MRLCSAVKCFNESQKRNTNVQIPERMRNIKWMNARVLFVFLPLLISVSKLVHSTKVYKKILEISSAGSSSVSKTFLSIIQHGGYESACVIGALPPMQVQYTRWELAQSQCLCDIILLIKNKKGKSRSRRSCLSLLYNLEDSAHLLL